MDKKYLFVVGGIFELEEVAKVYEVDQDALRKALDEYVEKGQPEEFVKVFDDLHVLFINKHKFLYLPLLRLGRVWGKGYRRYWEQRDGSKGKWLNLVVLPSGGGEDG